jgi:hypothetical protein
MPIEAQWYDTEKTILWFCYFGDWNWEDYTQTFQVKAVALVAGITHSIGTLHEIRSFPPRASIALMTNTMLATPPQIAAGVVVLNGPPFSNLLVRSVVNVVARIARRSQRLHYASTVDEGAALLRHLMAQRV